VRVVLSCYFLALIFFAEVKEVGIIFFYRGDNFVLFFLGFGGEGVN